MLDAYTPPIPSRRLAYRLLSRTGHLFQDALCISACCFLADYQFRFQLVSHLLVAFWWRALLQKILASLLDSLILRYAFRSPAARAANICWCPRAILNAFGRTTFAVHLLLFIYARENSLSHGRMRPDLWATTARPLRSSSWIYRGRFAGYFANDMRGILHFLRADWRELSLDFARGCHAMGAQIHATKRHWHFCPLMMYLRSSDNTIFFCFALDAITNKGKGEAGGGAKNVIEILV